MRITRRAFVSEWLAPLAGSVLAPATMSLARGSTVSLATQGRAQGGRREASAESRRAMIVATTGPIAIREGLDVLKQGGSAADAVLSTALGQIVLAAGSWVSFAGRMTAVYYNASTGRVDALNANYDAPREEDDPLSIPRQGTPSGRTALVPGFLAGVQALHDRFGRLPFARLFELAIRLADDGFVLGSGMARLIRSRGNVLTRLSDTRSIFTKRDGELFGQSERFRQRELAETLRNLAEHGSAYCYTGPWAKHFVETIRAEGGKITLDDLERYRVHWEQPLQTRYRDCDLFALPSPNRGGPLALASMNLADFAELPKHGPYTESAESLDRVLKIEQAMRLIASAGGRRRSAESLGTGELSLDDFARKEVGESLWARINSPEWPSIVRPNAADQKGSPHSDAVLAVDPEGNVAAILHTINTGGWGTSGIFVDGISIPDSAANQQRAVLAAGPGGRIADHGPPALVLRDGKPVLASSATGSGNFIATWQHMLGVLAFGMTPQQAADLPTFYAGTFEEGALPDALIQNIRDRGTPLKLVARLPGHVIGYWTGLSIDRDAGLLRGGKIRRLDGVAMGY